MDRGYFWNHGPYKLSKIFKQLTKLFSILFTIQDRCIYQSLFSISTLYIISTILTICTFIPINKLQDTSLFTLAGVTFYFFSVNQCIDFYWYWKNMDHVVNNRNILVIRFNMQTGILIWKLTYIHIKWRRLAWILKRFTDFKTQ